MIFSLYNSRTRTQQEFIPLNPEHIRMYVCGPTVYDWAHIGNARPVVVFDVVFRVLQSLYPAVTYVRNITDVDDKIMAAATANGESIEHLTARTARQYQADMAALNALPPTIEPRATEHIGQMIAINETLIAKGHAYAADGHVLFNVPSFAAYGALSGRPREDQIAGARVEVAPYKRDPADFVLWKPSDETQVGWDSPWGRGRPGWHIECSAMAGEHLGEMFDIHGGGIDLIFPHHENEIAQSCAAHGTDMMALFWMHNGHLTVDGEKMSKSLGNFITVHELLAEFPGEAIRYVLLSGHYRAPLDFTRDRVRAAKTSLDGLYGALRKVIDIKPVASDENGVMAALCDDLNTPVAIRVLHDLASEIHKTSERERLAILKDGLLRQSAVMGMLQQHPDIWFQGVSSGNDAEMIERLIAERKAARLAKDFAESDRIRDQITAMGIILEDTPGGTSWRRL